MADEVRINFNRSIPVFPIAGVVLLPHAIQPLHIFEPRYRQMVSDCLDSAGQIALACPAMNGPNGGGLAHGCTSGPASGDEHDHPALRPAVCVGQIVQHQPLPNDRHYILLQGVCRARLMKVFAPDEERLYLTARLDPLEPAYDTPPLLGDARHMLRNLLSGPRLQRMRNAHKIMTWLEDEEISTHILLELVGSMLLSDCDLQYRLLAEGRPQRRADLIETELRTLDRLVGVADRQPYRDWPKGVSWN